jgi:hypothetical protein
MQHLTRAVLAAAGFILLAFLCALAFGGVTVTQTEQKFELRDGAGSPVTELVGEKRVAIRRPTLDACKVMAEVEFRKLDVDSAPYRCVQVHELTLAGTCDDEPQPGPEEAIEGTKDAEGFTIVGKLETAACLADDTAFDIRSVKWVKGSWREKCWRKVETPIVLCNGQLGAAEAEGLPMETEEGTSPWIAGADFPADKPCPPEAAGNCYFPATVATRACPEQGCYRDQLAAKAK